MVPEVAVAIDIESKTESHTQLDEVNGLLLNLFNSSYKDTFTLQNGPGYWVFKTAYEETHDIDAKFLFALSFIKQNYSTFLLIKDWLSEIIIRFDIYACNTMPSLVFEAKYLKQMISLDLNISIEIDIVMTAENE